MMWCGVIRIQLCNFNSMTRRHMEAEGLLFIDGL